MISLEGYQVTREETQLSTEVHDNWAYAQKFFQALIVAGKAKGTIDTYNMHIRILLDDIQKPIMEITDEDLMLHLARQKYGRNLSNRYLNYKRLVFRTFFGWLRRRKYISENPAELLDQIKYDVTIKKPYTDEEREKIRCSCTRERDLALVDVLYSTAARVSEVAALNRSDIDFVRKRTVLYTGKGRKEKGVCI